MLLPPFAAFLSAGPLTSRDPPVQSPIRGLPVDALTPTAWLKRICAAEMAVATPPKAVEESGQSQNQRTGSRKARQIFSFLC